jgi:hypothetical protein
MSVELAAAISSVNHLAIIKVLRENPSLLTPQLLGTLLGWWNDEFANALVMLALREMRPGAVLGIALEARSGAAAVKCLEYCAPTPAQREILHDWFLQPDLDRTDRIRRSVRH